MGVGPEADGVVFECGEHFVGVVCGGFGYGEGMEMGIGVCI